MPGSLTPPASYIYTHFCLYGMWSDFVTVDAKLLEVIIRPLIPEENLRITPTEGENSKCLIRSQVQVLD